MKIFIVGGAVRDLVLGRPISDIDYLVQGATLDEFYEEFPDAEQVGKDFPVFLVDGE
jgi:tRNA nucleotidyltransferase (CCA-adding enzyme)